MVQEKLIVHIILSSEDDIVYLSVCLFIYLFYLDFLKQTLSMEYVVVSF